MGNVVILPVIRQQAESERRPAGPPATVYDLHAERWRRQQPDPCDLIELFPGWWIPRWWIGL